MPRYMRVQQLMSDHIRSAMVILVFLMSSAMNVDIAMVFAACAEKKL